MCFERGIDGGIMEHCIILFTLCLCTDSGHIRCWMDVTRCRRFWDDEMWAQTSLKQPVFCNHGLSCILCAVCVWRRECERKGRHRKGCPIYRLYDSLSKERVYAIRFPKEGRATSVASDWVVETFSLATTRDYYPLLSQDDEEKSAAWFRSHGCGSGIFDIHGSFEDMRSSGHPWRLWWKGGRMSRKTSFFIASSWEDTP